MKINLFLVIKFLSMNQELVPIFARGTWYMTSSFVFAHISERRSEHVEKKKWRGRGTRRGTSRKK